MLTLFGTSLVQNQQNIVTPTPNNTISEWYWYSNIHFWCFSKPIFFFKTDAIYWFIAHHYFQHTTVVKVVCYAMYVYWALGPKVCSNMPTNWEEPGVVYGSCARMALYFSVLGQREDWRSVTNCTGCHWLTYRHSIIPSDFLASLSHRPIKEKMDNVTIKHNLFTRCTKNRKWSWLTFNHFFSDVCLKL